MHAWKTALHKQENLQESHTYFREDFIFPLMDGTSDRAYTRGADYDFAPDRIACQDATAQMALLQFMQAGKLK